MRALLVVLDSVGIGAAPDAAHYGDEGANTLGHIFDSVPGFSLPNLDALGLPFVTGKGDASFDCCQASYGRMRQRSAGKDTTTGHWEIAGVILDRPFAVYDRFDEALIGAIERDAAVKFIGNYASSGTTIIENLGDEHIRTGRPILYTSADSVLQIAAHESVIPVHRLYEICEIARRHADRFNIGRVIARPFAGEAGKFSRTPRRHDFSMQPPRTILDAIAEQNLPVIGVGKISDVFAGRGITKSFPTSSNTEGMAAIARLWESTESGLVFANLVDFDMVFGHRRDVRGYAHALLEFDTWLGKFVAELSPQHLVIVTADHGNDPTYSGTDHTREEVPLFVLHRNESRALGTRRTFADIAATLGEFFELSEPWHNGSSFLSST